MNYGNFRPRIFMIDGMAEFGCGIAHQPEVSFSASKIQLSSSNEATLRLRLD